MHLIDQTTESRLVQSAREGDLIAFEALYRAYNDRVYNFAKRTMGSADDAGDVTQDTFVRAWNALPRLRDEATFGVWLHRIALNRCRDLLKKQGREQAQSLDCAPFDDYEPVGIQIRSDCPTPEQLVISDEMNDAIHRAVETLGFEHRVVVAMHHMEGMDVESISAALGVPKGTVMSRLSRARDALRRKLSPYIEEVDHDNRSR